MLAIKTGGFDAGLGACNVPDPAMEGLGQESQGCIGGPDRAASLAFLGR